MKKINKLLITLSSLSVFSVLPIMSISCTKENPKIKDVDNNKDKNIDDKKTSDEPEKNIDTNKVSESPDSKAETNENSNSSTADNATNTSENSDAKKTEAAKIIDIIKASNKNLFVDQSDDIKQKLDAEWNKKAESRDSLYVKRETFLFGINSNNAKDKNRQISLEWKDKEGKPSIDILKNMLYHYEYGPKKTKFIPLMKDETGNYFFRVKLLGDGKNKNVDQETAKKVTETFDIYL